MIKRKIKNKIELLFLLIILLSTFIYAAVPQPTAPDIMTNVSTQSPNVIAGYMLNTSGGTITTININATTQNPRWKGYIGNITGELALQGNASDNLFSWSLTTTTGELYATRSSSSIDWSNVNCAANTIDPVIATEQSALNIDTNEVDSINNTFDTSNNHDGFYVGTTQISSNSCPAIALNVNNTKQSSDFQEVLLTDNTNLVYTALIENSTYGFNNQTYDFQMIVAENAAEGNQPNTAYYFYIELI